VARMPAHTDPRPSHFHEIMLFWKTFSLPWGSASFFSTGQTNALSIKGLRGIVADCSPIKIAQGHLLDLIEKGVDTIFLPSVIKHAPDPFFSGPFFYLPYVQPSPTRSIRPSDFKSYGSRSFPQSYIRLDR